MNAVLWCLETSAGKKCHVGSVGVLPLVLISKTTGKCISKRKQEV